MVFSKQLLLDALSRMPFNKSVELAFILGGESAFLMAFKTDEATVYQVRSRHRNEEVREVVPADYAGVMVTDRARSYDAQALSGVRQPAAAGLSHVLRSISEVVETKVGRGAASGSD